VIYVAFWAVTYTRQFKKVTYLFLVYLLGIYVPLLLGGNAQVLRVKPFAMFVYGDNLPSIRFLRAVIAGTYRPWPRHIGAVDKRAPRTLAASRLLLCQYFYMPWSCANVVKRTYFCKVTTEIRSCSMKFAGVGDIARLTRRGDVTGRLCSDRRSTNRSTITVRYAFAR
jgi:hypothetical protein